MKVYIDNFNYFIDLISDSTDFEYSEDTQISINGELSPLNLLCYIFLENDNRLKSKDLVKVSLKQQYHTIYSEHTVVENPDEAEFLYIFVNNINFFKRIDEYKVNKQILKNLQSQKCKLLIEIPDDGWFGSKNNNTLEKLQEWLDDNNILQKNVYVKNLNLISNERKTKINMITDTIMSERYLRDTPSEVCKFNSIDKLFLNYNRNVTRHKLYLGYTLFQNNLIENALIGFSDKYLNSESIGQDYSFLNYNFNILYKFLKSLPYKIDNKNIKYLNDQGTIGQVLHHDDYERTFLSLVSESTCESGVVYLSEKTFKPIAMGHPFIIVGSQGSLTKLRDIGYKTFDKWWDEGYDECTSYKDRINRIRDILLTLKEISFSSQKIIREEMKEVIDYNFKLYNKRIKNENSFSNRL